MIAVIEATTAIVTTVRVSLGLRNRYRVRASRKEARPAFGWIHTVGPWPVRWQVRARVRLWAAMAVGECACARRQDDLGARRDRGREETRTVRGILGRTWRWRCVPSQR